MTARLLSFLLFLMPCAAPAQDILILGEVHDNPEHHAVQAREVAALAPAALVFEMLTDAQADGLVLRDATDPVASEAELDWNAGGWPDFSQYHTIFLAAPEAVIFGAGVPRETLRALMEADFIDPETEDDPLFRLEPLPQEEQNAREAHQLAVHCDALPPEVLPDLVAMQRYRDARLARVALTALERTGGPVAMITGNGHARRDWGVPALLERHFPDTTVRVIGQTEDGAPLDGVFDDVISAPSVDRPDPCEAFR